MKGRQRFKCTGCGLEIEGRERPDGRVEPWDRSGYDGSPVRPCICDPCNEGVTAAALSLPPALETRP